MSLLAAPTAVRPQPEAADSRGKAEVGVIANLLDASSPDKVSIRIVNNTDREKLAAIARVLGEKLNAAPTEMTFGAVDPTLVEDNGIGLEFRMRVVPRGERVLPVAPFIEAFAPYASELSILYIVNGPFSYRGVTSFKHEDVTVTVDAPTVARSAAGIPVAFYGIHAIIRNPWLTTAPLTLRQPGAGQREGDNRRPFPLLMLLVVAGMLGAAIGLLLAVWLARWKAAMLKDESATSIGGDHA